MRCHQKKNRCNEYIELLHESFEDLICEAEHYEIFLLKQNI